MGSGVNAVAQYELAVSVKFGERIKLESIQKIKLLSWLSNAYAETSTAISLWEFLERLNTYQKKDKSSSECILKGLFSGGTSGIHCTMSAPFLFFDIDVKDTDKKKENVHLLDPEKNKKVYEALQKIAVLTWRSNSGFGIAGILYVPQIAEFTNDTRIDHLDIGKAITNFLSEHISTTTGVSHVKFDDAQSKFRQPRFLAAQRKPIALNPDAIAIQYTATKVPKWTVNNLPVYYNANYSLPYGSVLQQFNNDNPILDIMLANGFSIVSNTGSKTRVKHINSSSPNCGEVDHEKNLYFNYSSSVSNKGCYNPATFFCEFNFNGDYKAFFQHLYDQGYKDKQLSEKEQKTLSTGLKAALEKLSDEVEISKAIFEYCYHLQTITNEAKRKFIDENCITPAHRKYFIEYLRYTDYSITYDAHFEIGQYVSEAIPDILQFADTHTKIIVRADTGSGKTYAVLNEIRQHRPQARILICAPLTMIVDQQEKAHPDKAVYLTGSSEDAKFCDAQTAPIIFATYEQAAKYLWHDFDYIIIDEVHELITANAYKHDVITELTQFFNVSKVIGLTATPLQIFKEIGFSLVNVYRKDQEATPVEVRICNRSAYDIALRHIEKVKSKTIIRLNDIEVLKAIKQYFIASAAKYKDDEVVILYSTKDIKHGDEFQYLANEERFADGVKLVLTTAIIDEGVNIRQAGFTDAVFIETSYTPRPEAVKQFFARFRNEDPTRKNYLYLPKKNNQEPTSYNVARDYRKTKEALQADVNGELYHYSTYNDIANNDNFYYSDKTVNPYYLAYYITGQLAKFMNIAQYLDFLEVNYYLKIEQNEAFEIETMGIKRSSNKKQLLGDAWLDHLGGILNTLLDHSQNNKLKKKITRSQDTVPTEIHILVLEYIKDVEKLSGKYFVLMELGVKDPNTILFDEYNLLVSDLKYKQEIAVLQFCRALNDPQNPTDEKNAAKFLAFADDCLKIREMVNKNKLFGLLKKHCLVNPRLENIEVLQEVFDSIGIDLFHDKKNTGKLVFKLKENKE